MLPPGAGKLALFILALIIVDKIVGISDMVADLVKPKKAA